MKHGEQSHVRTYTLQSHNPTEGLALNTHTAKEEQGSDSNLSHFPANRLRTTRAGDEKQIA